MGINKPRWKYLLQEEGDGFHIQLEDGNNLVHADGTNAYILLEQSQQSIGCDPSPLLSIGFIMMIVDFVRRLYG